MIHTISTMQKRKIGSCEFHSQPFKTVAPVCQTFLVMDKLHALAIPEALPVVIFSTPNPGIYRVGGTDEWGEPPSLYPS